MHLWMFCPTVLDTAEDTNEEGLTHFMVLTVHLSNNLSPLSGIVFVGVFLYFCKCF